MKLIKISVSIFCLLVGEISDVFASGLFEKQYLLPSNWPDYHVLHSSNLPVFSTDDVTVRSNSLSDHILKNENLSCQDSRCILPNSHCHLLCESEHEPSSFITADRVINEIDQPVTVLHLQRKTLLAQVREQHVMILDIAIDHDTVASLSDDKISLLMKQENNAYQLISLQNLGNYEQNLNQALPVRSDINWVVNDDEGTFWVVISTKHLNTFVRLDSYIALMHRYDNYLRWKREMARHGHVRALVSFEPIQTPKRKRTSSKKQEIPPAKRQSPESMEQPVDQHIVAIQPGRGRERKQTQKAKEMQEFERSELNKSKKKKLQKPHLKIAKQLKIPDWLININSSSLVSDLLAKTNELISTTDDPDEKQELEITLVWLKVADSLCRTSVWRDFVIPFSNKKGLTENYEAWSKELTESVWKQLIDLAKNLATSKIKPPKADTEVSDSLKNALLGLWIDEALYRMEISANWRALKSYQEGVQNRKVGGDPAPNNPVDEVAHQDESSPIRRITLNTPHHEIEMPETELKDKETQAAECLVECLRVTTQCAICSSEGEAEYFKRVELVDVGVQTEMPEDTPLSVNRH